MFIGIRNLDNKFPQFFSLPSHCPMQSSVSESSVRQ